ncbi:MAG: AMP-binding protein [Candidatus Bipolaricaulota bacterium]|nr:AMP-binding protein [Candidatus Bipolaricaulota bacterium]
MYPTVSRLFEDAVQSYKDRIALRMPVPKERRSARGTQFVLNEVSYGRLAEMVGRLATALKDLGVGRGDRVALAAKPRTAWATSFFAILRCGATVVPLDPELQKNEIERILIEAQVKGVIASGSKMDDLVAIRDAGSLGSAFLVSMDRSKDENVLFLDALLLGKNPLPLIDVAPSDLAILMYTSGTTGNAKGAMLTHANISSNTLAAQKVVELRPEDRFLSIVPWNHIYGLTMTLICPLVTGATTTYTPVDRNLTEVMRSAKPTILLGVPKLFNVLHGRITESIEKSAIKHVIYHLSPTLMGRLVRNKLFGKQFRFFASGGAPLSPVSAAGLRHLGLGILEGYGLTETSPLLTMCEAFNDQPGMKTIEDVEIRIEGPDDTGVGEVMARGPGVMAGYYKNPEATAEVLEPDGWFHTGDLGSYRNGRLVLCGRAKNVIVLETGKNVYPEEIEWELVTIPSIEEVMVYQGDRQGVPTVCAEIYPNWTFLKAHGVKDGDKDAALEMIWEAVKEKCENLAMFKRIKYKESLTLVDEPFQKSVKLDIKRYLYKPAT